MRAAVLAPTFALLLLTATLGVATVDGSALACAGSCVLPPGYAEAAAEATLQAVAVALTDLQGQLGALTSAAHEVQGGAQAALMAAIDALAMVLAQLLADVNFLLQTTGPLLWLFVPGQRLFLTLVEARQQVEVALLGLAVDLRDGAPPAEERLAALAADPSRRTHVAALVGDAARVVSAVGAGTANAGDAAVRAAVVLMTYLVWLEVLLFELFLQHWPLAQGALAAVEELADATSVALLTGIWQAVPPRLAWALQAMFGGSDLPDPFWPTTFVVAFVAVLVVLHALLLTKQAALAAYVQAVWEA